jgi:hypothetical protein
VVDLRKISAAGILDRGQLVRFSRRKKINIAPKIETKSLEKFCLEIHGSLATYKDMI